MQLLYQETRAGGSIEYSNAVSIAEKVVPPFYMQYVHSLSENDCYALHTLPYNVLEELLVFANPLASAVAVAPCDFMKLYSKSYIVSTMTPAAEQNRVIKRLELLGKVHTLLEQIDTLVIPSLLQFSTQHNYDF
jgi:hypothetical protein